MSDKLIFEAVGVPCDNGTQSCRIRSRLKDGNGSVVYLELSGVKRNKNLTENMLKTPFEQIGYIEHAFYEKPDGDESDKVERRIPCYFDYTNDGILSFVNSLLETNYQSILFDENIRVFETKDCIC
ncbi:hypothetical protein [Pseudoalteromonas sp. MEBiC 03485]|uniref:hypothetical protein n=1 Tax=Pseudoalteromonas sp. MEBiC 03485 TaxID=2571103 RepID=UPI00102056B9|nr:hypothetical protein [Pseudoalteromonas sp. MEBiC 03485]RZD19753.1 hypothetical protein EVU92_21355 [Pseudoalteromonas sp. MEBiC 03485]